MSEVNIDANQVYGGDSNLSCTGEKLVGMTNGCIYCTVRDALRQEVRWFVLQERDGLCRHDTRTVQKLRRQVSSIFSCSIIHPKDRAAFLPQGRDGSGVALCERVCGHDAGRTDGQGAGGLHL